MGFGVNGTSVSGIGRYHDGCSVLFKMQRELMPLFRQMCARCDRDDLARHAEADVEHKIALECADPLLRANELGGLVPICDQRALHLPHTRAPSRQRTLRTYLP